ncbi:MAG: SRPBCC family protein [Caulobacterales bacterium]
MTVTIKPAPVRKSITVKAPPQRAFEVFTTRFADWWPATHHIGASAYKTSVLEPRVGGRWYEIGEDGAECEWGDVLAWEPPGRLVLAWRISANWQYDHSVATELEVTFTGQPDGATRVDLEHRHLERLGEGAGTMREAFEGPGGWSGILAAYVAVVEA